MAVHVSSSGLKFTDNFATGQSYTQGSNFTAGNTGIVSLVHYGAGGTNRILSVTIGGTAAVKDLDLTDTGTTNHAEVWRATNMAGGTNAFSFTCTAGSGQYISLGANEFSGLHASPLGQTGNSALGGTSSTAPTVSSSAPTTETDELVVALFVDIAGTNWTSATPPGSYTESWEQPDGSSHEAGTAAYRTSTTIGTQTATFATGGTVNYVAGLVTYKNAAAGGSYSLTAEQGSFTLSGQAAGLRSARRLTAAQGSYTLTGQNATLATAGAFTGSGLEVGASLSYVGNSYVGAPAATGGGGGPYTLTAEQGSYSLAGQASALRAARRMTAAQGSYALTGQAAGVRSGRRLTAAQGSYTILGSVALVDLSITAQPGSYALTGQNATLTRTGGSPYSMAAEQGSYSLTGQASALRAGRRVLAAQGSYTLSGQQAGLRSGRRLIAAQGSYALSGQAAALRTARRLAAAQGSYALGGQLAGLNYSAGAASLVAEQGSYALTGQLASLRSSRRLVAAQGSYTLAGQAALLPRSYRITAAQGSYTLTGRAALFGLARRMAAAQGSYGLAGQQTTLTSSGAAKLMVAQQGSFVLTGHAANLRHAARLQLQAGSYSLTGQLAALLYSSAPVVNAEHGTRGRPLPGGPGRPPQTSTLTRSRGSSLRRT